MNSLLEPRCAPQLPDLMLLDDFDAEADASWLAGMGVDWSAGSGCQSRPAPASAPVPIAPAARRCMGTDLAVDSLDSTQTLLGSSLHDAAPHPSSMRFVPVGMQQQPHPQFVAHSAPSFLLGGPEQGYSSCYEPMQTQMPMQQQQYNFKFEHHAPAAAPAHSIHQHHAASYPNAGALAATTWDSPAPPLMTHTAAAPSHHASSGISSHDIQYGYSMQFGQQLPIPMPQKPYEAHMRRAASEDMLHSSRYPSSICEHIGSLPPVVEGESLGSEGSDSDTLAGHHHHQHQLHHSGLQTLPSSHSAPSASAMMLERSTSSRRSHLSGGSRGTSTASPRPICLKVKASRVRPAPSAAAVRAAVMGGSGCGGNDGDVSPRPARLSARRSVVLSAVGDDELGSDSDVEPVASTEASEERRSGGSSGATQQAGTGKKKHNPWSLTETEALVEGVRLLGPSKWAEIKKLAVSGIADLLANRSAVDLKDKWRNLTRVAKLPKSVLKARAHKSTSDIPLDLLLTVKELMDMGRD